MTFTKRAAPVIATYSLNGSSLTRVRQYKYLGVTFTHNLSWSAHIDQTCSKALKKLGYLRRTMQKAPKDTKLLMYKTLVRPIIDYGATVWSPHNQNNIIKLEAVQKKAVRFIFRRYDRYFSPSSALPSLNLTLLSVRRDVESLKFLHNIINMFYRTSNTVCLSFAKPSSTRNFHELNLFPFYARTNTFKYSFFPRTIEVWNSLPGCLRSLPISEFESALYEKQRV